jgi:hypothetical protein
LREFLHDTELPKVEIARGIGTTPEFIRYWATGKRKPRETMLDRIEIFLDRQRTPGLTREEVLKAF